MPRGSELQKPTAKVSERMRRVATSATAPEIRVRRVVRRLKLRYTCKTSRLPGRPDLLLLDYQVAIFVHGCFWHGCSRCYVEPKRNRLWWRKKIANNQLRDRRKAAQLRRLGYSVMTVMEHDTEVRLETRLRGLVTRG